MQHSNFSSCGTAAQLGQWFVGWLVGTGTTAAAAAAGTIAAHIHKVVVVVHRVI